MMIIEEFRFNTSFSNKRGFMLFPIMILLFTLILAYASPQLFKQISYKQILISLHSSLFLYGISMGSFAFLGREYVERRSGKINFLISSPLQLPIKFRETFVAFYLHDVIFYYFIVIVPLTCGLLLSIPFSGYSYISILFLSSTLLITFVIGLAFSFFASAVFIKRTSAFLILISSVFALMLGIIFLELNIGLLLPGLLVYSERSITFFGLSMAYILFLSLFAAFLIEERFEFTNAEYRNEYPDTILKFKWFKTNSHLLAKEYLDLIRSRALTKIAFSFILPLLFITFISWILKTNVVSEIEFNSVFYASMVGFFSVMIYYWLTTMDNLEAFQTLPLDVPTVIRSKLIIFIIISSVISSIYIFIISGIYNEFHLVGLSLFIMFVTSLYIATSTAYLTGLRTHNYLFNFGILFRFTILSALPLVCLQIIVLNLNTYWFVALTALIIAGIIMSAATIILYRGIDKKWARTEFV